MMLVRICFDSGADAFESDVANDPEDNERSEEELELIEEGYAEGIGTVAIFRGGGTGEFRDGEAWRFRGGGTGVFRGRAGL